MKKSMADLQAADVDLSSKNDKVGRTVKILLARVQALNEAMDGMNLVLVRTEQSVRFATPDSTPEEATDELMDFIMSDDKESASA